MTTRNFDALFAPRAIALVGASARPGSVGGVIAENLLAGRFDGELMFVNPRLETLHGRKVWASVADLPTTPDLAVIATPAAVIPGVVAELGARGCRAAVVISAGFEGAESAALRQALLDAARPHLLRIVGPNCLGLLSPGRGINASFAQGAAPAGDLALVAQSGAVAAALLDWAPANGLGFSHVVTVGDSLDVDVGDLLDHLGRDPATRAILLYLESLRDARKFMSAARFAARAKPVVVLKGGRSAAGAKAAFSHTGALAGADAVFGAAFRRAGVLQVNDFDAFLDAAATFERLERQAGRRLAVLTNGGGAGVLAVDALEQSGVELAELSAPTLAALEAKAPANWSRRNPVDILGDAPPALFGEALAILLQAPEADGVLVLNCPTAVSDRARAAEAVAAAARGADRPVLSNWLGAQSVAMSRGSLLAAGIPAFATPEAGVRGFGLLAAAGRLRELLSQSPDGTAGAGDVETARAIVRRAIAEGRTSLAPEEVDGLLRAYGVPTVRVSPAATADEAGRAAAEFGGPVALKIRSRDISHKSDVGGVALDLSGAEATRAAAEAMLQRVRAARPDAAVEGFLVQPMIQRPKAQEMLAGVVQDPTFGPMVMVGHGGVAVEARADRALGLPPLNDVLAREMIGRTRISRLLAGFRDRPPADLDALARILISLGRLATDLPEVAELDLNPVLCDETGALTLDARVAVREVGAQVARPAILPYPDRLTRRIDWAGGPLALRPVHPQDAQRLVEMVDRCTPEDVQLRFGGAMRHLDPELAAGLAQIDYDRQMALAAETAAGEIAGVARLDRDPEGETAEFALMVRSDLQGRGLGRLLLGALLDYADEQGMREVWGQTAQDNARLLGVARGLGFVAKPAPDDPSRVRLVRRSR